MNDLSQALETNLTTDYKYAYSPASDVKTLSFATTVSRLREKVAPFRFSLAAKQITKELNLKSGEKILELGSGLGLLGEAIKKEVGGNLEYYGVDLAYNPTSKSKEFIEATQANAIKLPFANNSFDAVVSTDLLEHITSATDAISEIKRVLREGGKAFVVIADPSEGRFAQVSDHINRTGEESNVNYWENLFEKNGFNLLSKNSDKYRKRDWRKIFNLPFLVRFKEKPGFACAFNPVNRPGTYILEKPMTVVTPPE